MLNVNNMTGFGAAGGGPSGPATVTLTDSKSLADFSGQTWSGASIGTADRFRHVVLTDGPHYGEAYTAVTIGGVSATSITEVGTNCTIWIALVPSGTTADIVVTGTSYFDRLHAVYSLYNLESDTPEGTSISDTYAPTMTEGSVAITFTESRYDFSTFTGVYGSPDASLDLDNAGAWSCCSYASATEATRNLYVTEVGENPTQITAWWR